MEKAIFDSSVWINLSRNVTNKETELLLDYISTNSAQVFLTPTIIQEILQGVKTERGFREKLNVLDSFNRFEDDWLTTSISAAGLYSTLRRKGITIRKSTDCLIAQVAIQNDVLLVHNDSDFELIAKGSELRTFS